VKTPPKPPARGKLKSMRVSAGFRDYVLDQLSGVRGLRAKAMFGGVGIYADDVFFGILASDVLYFKVDDTNRRAYELAGSKPFRPYDDRSMTMPYYAVPLDVLEAAPTLVEWAEQAVAVARSAKPKPGRTPKVRARRASPTRTAARRASRRK
jgi:DNA transformation protein and related proteins